jgi:predicted RNA-binding Zn-ribbon protein involved in translation (DUF1610 family)
MVTYKCLNCGFIIELNHPITHCGQEMIEVDEDNNE